MKHNEEKLKIQNLEALIEMLTVECDENNVDLAGEVWASKDTKRVYSVYRDKITGEILVIISAIPTMNGLLDPEVLAGVSGELAESFLKSLNAKLIKNLLDDLKGVN